VSYESEERYWTDYLRVALPVIGLLLMLALFWWWAQQFIGDDKSGDQVAFEATQTTEIATRPAPTATNTQEVAVAATEVVETPTSDNSAGNDGNSSGNDGNAENTPSDGQQPQDCGFTKAQKVVVTQDGDGLRLRSEPAQSDSNIIATLDAGTQLVIVGDCYVEDADGNRYWRVRDQTTSRTGYVSAEYIEADTSGD
jgi:hypothetical protein